MKTQYVITETHKVSDQEQSVKIAETLAVLIKAAVLREADKQIA